MKDGKIDPLDGMSSPITLGTLSALLAMTRVIQILAGKESKIIDKVMESIEAPAGISDPDARRVFEGPAKQIIEVAKETRKAMQELR
ncbi:hypothetical protein [Pseudomonas sp. S2_A05]